MTHHLFYKLLLTAFFIVLLLVFPIKAIGDVVITNVTVVSPEQQTIQPGQTVVIRDERIVAVSASDVSESDSDQRIDGTGRYLIPGLMDSHLHSSVIPGLGFEGSAQVNALPKMHRAYTDQFPKSLLYFGITQFLDPAPDAAALERVVSAAVHPDVFHCGAVFMRGGYPFSEIGLKAIADNFPYQVDDDIDEAGARSLVERIKKSGSICVKLFFENGFGPRDDLPMPTQDTFKKLVTAAHNVGLIVVGHANALDMHQLAMDARVDVLGHGLWNWGQHRASEGLPTAITEHLDEVIRQKTSYQPTLRVIDGIQAMFDPDLFNDPILEHVVASPLLNWYNDPAAHWFKNLLVEDEFEGLPESRIHDIMAGVANKGERALVYLAENGHPVLLASDHPAHPGHANHPGYSSYLELTQLAKIGVPLDKIFAGATLANAQAFGLDNDYGTVEVGKVANLLLLSGNPLEHIKAYDQIEFIIIRGRVIDRATLSATVN